MRYERRKPGAARTLGTALLVLFSAALGALTLTGHAQAQARGFTLDAYSASETIEDGFHLSRPDDHGHGRFGAMLHLDYANDPLVVAVTSAGKTKEYSVVSDQLVAHLRVSLGLWHRLVLFGGVDATLLMKGQSFPDPTTGASSDLADGTGLGDARVGARLRLLGENEDLAGLALQATVTLPLARAAASGQNFTGEHTAAFIPELLFELRPGPVRITANVGTRLRGGTTLGNTSLSNEVDFGLGATFALVKDKLDLLAEVYGNTSYKDFFGRNTTPFEGLLGLKGRIFPACVTGLAAGPGLQKGFGSPDFRIVAMFGCETLAKEPPPPDVDSDHDGILDSADRCPRVPEDKDGFQDRDGCPDPDNDGDGILDVNDKCPLEAEDKDEYDDADGCPDPDNDGDGILDVKDECPLEAEDVDGFKDDDGCADPDNDEDGILDANDKCPLEAEDKDGFEDDDGCPEEGPVRLTCGKLELSDKVFFDTGSDHIQERSYNLLDQVASVLQKTPDVTKVRIEGHTDNKGVAKKNLVLSKRRATSVKTYLMEHGIESSRLTSEGYGQGKPIADNKTEDGRSENRRVEFVILEQTGGCKPAQ